ncbi:MAG TPA: hypothetical protein VLN25_08055 [Burkholderiaceae bacterium]|nr:hypothetical protein [Burkholderiaceae bacterium]
MSNDAEPRFSGMPAAPAPEVFADARRNNPEWFQLVERAYEQFAALPENVGVYADPKGSGATIEQIWLVLTLFGVEPYCLLARPLPAVSTKRISRLVNCKATQIIEALKTIQAVNGEVNVPLAYHDGKTGHCIRITDYDSGRDRFIYHDPWPERSLLAKENNPAGVDAQPDGTRWSVTAQELERVVFAAFAFPSQWARVRGQDFDILVDPWKDSDFFKFFRLKQLDERAVGEHTQRSFAPGAFQQDIALKVECNKVGKIKRASLLLTQDWTIGNFMLALDLAKSFVASFAPAPDRTRYDEIAAALWSLRDPRALLKAKETDPKESDGVRCVHAFMGSLESASIVTDFSHLSIGSTTHDGRPARLIAIDLS